MPAKLITTSMIMTVLAFAPALSAAPQTTDILAVYAIDSDTNELVRYSFADNTFLVMGTVRTSSGTVVKDMECLGYVPAMGMYSVPTKAPFKGQVVRIDPITAQATAFAPVVVPSGRKVTGMASIFDMGTGTWYLLAASSEDTTSSTTAVETRALIRIDPATGVGTTVATNAQLGAGLRFEGLGVDSKGDVYATSRTRFFRIHQEAGYWVEDLGSTGLDKAEAFEVAFGDVQPSIDVPGVNSSWTNRGVFFVADEQLQKFGVVNPSNGTFVEYTVNGAPSAFVTKDAEGMILLTNSRDPLYGMYVTFD